MDELLRKLRDGETIALPIPPAKVYEPQPAQTEPKKAKEIIYSDLTPAQTFTQPEATTIKREHLKTISSAIPKLNFLALMEFENRMARKDVDELKEIAHDLRILANRYEKELLAGKTKEERLKL